MPLSPSLPFTARRINAACLLAGVSLWPWIRVTLAGIIGIIQGAQNSIVKTYDVALPKPWDDGGRKVLSLVVQRGLTLSYRGNLSGYWKCSINNSGLWWGGKGQDIAAP